MAKNITIYVVYPRDYYCYPPVRAFYNKKDAEKYIEDNTEDPDPEYPEFDIECIQLIAPVK